jgi:hypothetical protein
MAPDTRQRRPHHKGAATVDQATDDLTVAGEIRRRREAAHRLPPLGSGYRDPLDELAGLPITDRGDACRGMFTGNGRWVPCCRGAA